MLHIPGVIPKFVKPKPHRDTPEAFVPLPTYQCSTLIQSHVRTVSHCLIGDERWESIVIGDCPLGIGDWARVTSPRKSAIAIGNVATCLDVPSLRLYPHNYSGESGQANLCALVPTRCHISYKRVGMIGSASSPQPHRHDRRLPVGCSAVPRLCLTITGHSVVPNSRDLATSGVICRSA